MGDFLRGMVIALCLPVLSWHYDRAKVVSVHFLDARGAECILSMPARDREQLLGLMRLLFAQDNFAYTLLGSKPVSWACYQKPWPFVSLSEFSASWRRYSRTLRLGWKVWSKYRYLFPSAALWEECSGLGWRSILIVNEERFNGVVNAHKGDFQGVLHREIVDGFQLLKEAKGCSLMHEVLQGHQALLGIVLGYGRENAWAFLEKSEKRIPPSCVWDTTATPSEGLRVRDAAVDIEGCLALESCPSFAGDPFSQESLALKEAYLQTRQDVLEYYKGQDFLEATLSLLAGFRPRSPLGKEG